MPIKTRASGQGDNRYPNYYDDPEQCPFGDWSGSYESISYSTIPKGMIFSSQKKKPKAKTHKRKPYLGKKPRKTLPKKKPIPKISEGFRRMPDFPCDHWKTSSAVKSDFYRVHHPWNVTIALSPTGGYIPSNTPTNEYRECFLWYDEVKIADVKDYLAMLDSVTPDADLISAGVNIFTILLELAESKAIVSSGVKALQSFFKEGIAKGASQSYLWYNWGAIPLVNDLVTVVNLINNLRSSVDDWNQAAAKQVTRTRSKKFRYGTYRKIKGPFPSASTSYAENVSADGFTANIYDQRITIRYIPGHIDNLSYLKLWADRIGLSHPLSGVWEGVPFSWLIDYFVNVGDFLESLEPRIYLPMQTVSIINSVKVRRIGKVDVTAYAYDYKHGFPARRKMEATSEGNQQFYKRWIVDGGIAKQVINLSHNAKNSLSLKRLTGKHILNLLAFGIAKKR